MRLSSLTPDRTPDFVDYCRRHKAEVDDSYLYDDQLAKFQPDQDNPTYILTGPKGEVQAAASLMIDDYHRRGRRARFRIFHSEADGIMHYQTLMQAMLKHAEGLDKYIVFVGMDNPPMAGLVERLGFRADRYSFVLLREESGVPEPRFPEGYEVRSFTVGRDEKAG